jgi:hypothetical protein
MPRGVYTRKADRHPIGCGVKMMQARGTWQRNLEILAALERGESYRDVAIRFELSPTRVVRIEQAMRKVQRGDVS